MILNKEGRKAVINALKGIDEDCDKIDMAVFMTRLRESGFTVVPTENRLSKTDPELSGPTNDPHRI